MKVKLGAMKRGRRVDQGAVTDNLTPKAEVKLSTEVLVLYLKVLTYFSLSALIRGSSLFSLLS